LSVGITAPIGRELAAASSVCLATVPDAHDSRHAGAVVDFVENAVVTDTDPIVVSAATAELPALCANVSERLDGA
jgi:hypothetical protein